MRNPETALLTRTYLQPQAYPSRCTLIYACKADSLHAACRENRSVDLRGQARLKATVLPLDRTSTRRRAMPSSTTNSTSSCVAMR